MEIFDKIKGIQVKLFLTVPGGEKMKIIILRPIWLLALAAAIVLGACSLPVLDPGDPEPTPDPDAQVTAAVQTLVADLTQAAAQLETQAAQATNTPPPPPTATPTEEILPTPTPLPTDTPAPSPTSTPTPTEVPPTPTQTPPLTPTLTPLASDPRPGLGNPTLRDTFQDAANWNLTEDDHARMEILNGQLVMTSFNPDFWNSWAFTGPRSQNFYLEISGSSGACSGRDRFGLIFRAPDNTRGYLYGLSCDGSYSLWIWDGSTEIRLIDWTSSPYINAGSDQINRIGVMVRGNQISLYANGSLLTEVSDGTYESGRFGVFVGSAATENYTARIDELAFWESP
jgi:hypothetical protein